MPNKLWSASSNAEILNWRFAAREWAMGERREGMEGKEKGKGKEGEGGCLFQCWKQVDATEKYKQLTIITKLN